MRSKWTRIVILYGPALKADRVHCRESVADGPTPTPYDALELTPCSDVEIA
jgi:hypothetical protein